MAAAAASSSESTPVLLTIGESRNKAMWAYDFARRYFFGAPNRGYQWNTDEEELSEEEIELIQKHIRDEANKNEKYIELLQKRELLQTNRHGALCRKLLPINLQEKVKAGWKRGGKEAQREAEKALCPYVDLILSEDVEVRRVEWNCKAAWSLGIFAKKKLPPNYQVPAITGIQTILTPDLYLRLVTADFHHSTVNVPRHDPLRLTQKPTEAPQNNSRGGAIRVSARIGYIQSQSEDVDSRRRGGNNIILLLGALSFVNYQCAIHANSVAEAYQDLPAHISDRMDERYENTKKEVLQWKALTTLREVKLGEEIFIDYDDIQGQLAELLEKEGTTEEKFKQLCEEASNLPCALCERKAPPSKARVRK